MNLKRFHKSDSTLFCFNMIDYPLNLNGMYLTREYVAVHASDNVTWQEIAQEIHTARKGPSPDLYFLKTCMVDYADFVVSLTLNGALKIVMDLVESNTNKVPKEYLYFDQVDSFAKEMIEERDFCKHVIDCKNNELNA